MVEWAAVYAAFKGALGAIGKIREDAVKIELQGYILDLQSKLSDLVQENATLADEIHRLKDEATERPTLADYQFDGVCYRDKEKRPYCTNCFENAKRLRSLIQVGETFDIGRCSTCNRDYPRVFDVTTSPTVEDRPPDLNFDSW